MKSSFLFFMLFTISCSHEKNAQANGDVFDRIIHVHKTGTKESLLKEFGSPIEKKTEAAKDLVEYKYEKFSTSVNEQDGRLYGTSMSFWVNFDAYTYLRKRFEKYKWIETKLIPEKNLDYEEELRKVQIPELGITFEYDNQDPLRRPMWIFIK